MRYGRGFTACEPETQGLFTVLYTETYPSFSHTCCQVFHDAGLPVPEASGHSAPCLGKRRECRLESADRLTACSQPVSAKREEVFTGYPQKHTRFFDRPVPGFCTSLSVNARGPKDRSQMTASPRSYDLLLHRLVSDFSTELSPVHQPVLHNLSTGLSTGCTYPLRGSAAANQSRAHQRGPARRRTAAER
jgi:hypothetical protein